MQAFNSKVINILFLSGLFVVIIASFARYYYLKEFPINIEVPCDPVSEMCFYRDCEVEDECPPNGLSTYRQFEISGRAFATCSEVDGCESFCENSGSECIELVCGESEDDVCAEAEEVEEPVVVDVIEAKAEQVEEIE